jgi:hypothetical protein
VKPLGCRTHLETKAEGEISMFEKAGCIETIKGHARRDPDGMVKAELPEPQWPNRKGLGLDTMVDIQCSQIAGIPTWPVNTLRGTGLTSSTLRPRTGHLNRPERHPHTKCGIA